MLGGITNKTMVRQLQCFVKCLMKIGGKAWGQGQVINPQAYIGAVPENLSEVLTLTKSDSLVFELPHL